MSKDPRKAKTLGEAAANGDGTYNGFKLLSWLSECANPGRGLSEEEVRAMYAMHEMMKAEHGSNPSALSTSSATGEDPESA